MRQLIGAACGLVMIAIAACQPTPPVATPVPPTTTLVGAFVPTRISTETPTSTVTPTATPSQTLTPSETPSTTPRPSETPSATPSITRTPSPTSTPSNTPTATLTPSPTPSATNDATRIQVGEGATPIAATGAAFTYDSEITDTEPRIRFIFDGEAGEIVGIQMQVISGDLDPYLLLTNASGEIIFENDDDPSGFGRDAYIREFELPETGRYFVIATRFDQEEGDSEGEFALSIERAGDTVTVATAEATPIPSTDSTVLVCDQTISQTIDDAQYAWRFSFEASEGEVIGIQMVATSGDLDSIVRLLNEEGDVLEENDDDEQGIGKDAYLREIEIPETATYLVEASRFQDDLGTTAGNFDLTLVCSESGT